MYGGVQDIGINCRPKIEKINLPQMCINLNKYLILSSYVEAHKTFFVLRQSDKKLFIAQYVSRRKLEKTKWSKNS